LDNAIKRFRYFVLSYISIKNQHHYKNKYYLLSCVIEKDITPRIFLDISDVYKSDSGTGIQRVIKNICDYLIKNTPEGYEICPIYLHHGRFYHAKKFLSRWYNIKFNNKSEFLKFSGKDLFIGLTLQGNLSRRTDFMNIFVNTNTKIYFLVYDLIPIHFAHYCHDCVAGWFPNWLHAISKFDGIIADSRSAADDYREWKKANIPDSGKPFLIDWFHLGADLEKGLGTTGIPADSAPVFEAMKARPSLLEVSTVEPRKGHKQTLAAFEQLWAKGVEANFVIVGKPGWKMDDFFKRVEQHPEFGRRLFWLKGISDEYLNAVYEAASGVIMPSEAEGFGLAVIEGAHHGKPLILRDIPVFREIAGDNATYFSGLEPKPLAECLELWLEDFKRGSVIPSTGIKPLTWAESAQMLLQRLGLATAENPSKD